MQTFAVKSIEKNFSHKKALDDVSIIFTSKSITAILGENGAGKSTLSAIMSGSIQPDKGSIFIDDKQVKISSPQKATELGIQIVHQQPLLAPELTVWENIILGAEKTFANSIIRKKEVIKEIEKIRSSWNLKLNIETRASMLSASRRFYTALLIALYRKPSILILDEPSASLDKNQRISLFSRLQEQVDKGMCVIFITHNPEEAVRNAKKIIILRKGKKIEEIESNTKNCTPEKIESILFPEITNQPIQVESNNTDKKQIVTSEQRLLHFFNVTIKPNNGPSLFNITFSVYAGEITCIFGQREAGLSTLENIVSGMYRGKYTGTITFRDKEVQTLSASFLRKNKTSIVPSDKITRGSDPKLSISEMLSFDPKTTTDIIQSAKTDIQPEESVTSLSGGMLQRLIISRELYTRPALLILASPTYGLDRAATTQLIQTLRTIADTGTAVLVLSVTDSEIEKNADSLYRINAGEVKLVKKGKI